MLPAGPRSLSQAYYQSLRRVQLSGPTLFQAVINQAASIANSTKHYNSVRPMGPGCDTSSSLSCVAPQREKGNALPAVTYGVRTYVRLGSVFSFVLFYFFLFCFVFRALVLRLLNGGVVIACAKKVEKGKGE